MIGKPAVAGIENVRDARNLGRGMERPSPPDLSRQKYDGFGAAVNLALACCHAHFPEQFFTGQIKKGLHARILQGRQAEAALFEGTAEAAGERSADGTVTIEENPAAGGLSSFCISHF
jgi:hypothetical protein